MIPPNAIELVIAFEGFYAKPYLCPANVPTIGYGTIRYPDGRRVKLTDSEISEKTAILYMENEMTKCFTETIRICPILLTCPEEWLGAIMDFTYNLGTTNLQNSTLRRKINAEEWDEVPTQLSRWVYGGGRVLRGLVLRRQAEGAFYG
jgi:Phage-related lysozyme (muraminidase)